MKPKQQVTAIIKQHLGKTIADLATFADQGEALATANPHWLPLVVESRKVVANFDALAEAGNLNEIKQQLDSCLLSWRTFLGYVQIGHTVN